MAGKSSLSVRLRRAPTRYKPLSRIAVGGMAEVWRAQAAFESGDTYPVAIKRVLPQIAQDPFYMSMFKDEARLGMLLRHRNIVRVYDGREVAGTFIMVMELVDGCTLKGLLDGAHAREAKMPLAAALHIARELARALDYAHTACDDQGEHLGIIHRDVSPHNLLLGIDGAVKLTDFGLADANSQETQNAEGLVGGKLGYLAPEIIHQKKADHRIDIFAAGIMLWEMLAGRRLFQAADDATTVRNVAACNIPSIKSINPRVPRQVEALINRMLAANPDERLRSAAQAFQALDTLIERIDKEVGPRDVSLLVHLHRATKEEEEDQSEIFDVAHLLAQELDQFAAAGAGLAVDMGAEALDPSEFDLGLRSGVRARPRE